MDPFCRCQIGYNVSIYTGGLTVNTAQRMSSVGEGTCAPTHIQLEVWDAGIKAALKVYANESYCAGGVGYYGQSGIFTTSDFVNDGQNESLYSPLVFPNYWKHYQYDERVITALNASHFFNNAEYYPPKENTCEDGTLGCINACARTKACTIRETEQNKTCLVILMQYSNYDRGYYQAVMSNLNISAYMCFIGHDAVEAYALEAQRNRTPVLFFHYEPDYFHVAHPGKFERVMLPRPVPARVALATGDFGEYGYGNGTDNPIDVDFPSYLLMKYAASLLSDLPISSFLSKYTISDLDMASLLASYINSSADSSDPDPMFTASCNWIKTNYDTWRLWLDRLPLCTFASHIKYDVSGCNSTTEPRVITFSWNKSNPDNKTLPYECDGGYAKLPDPLKLSRSCEWIEERSTIWIDWITNKPDCDSSFYNYTVSGCNSDAKRIVSYQWLLPSSSNSSKSGECEDGESLPSAVTIDCEYVPGSSPVVVAVAVVAGIQILALFGLFIFIYRNRGVPIIKRSQFELLELMIFGGFFTTGAAVAYAGRPTHFLCGLRPILLSFGFTTVFGSLFVKSLRVYRVFMQKAMKRTIITLRMMLKVLAMFYLIDVVILVTWAAVDYPDATIVSETAVEFRGSVDRIACRSSSFIFSALFMFWKAILLFAGLYMSFLIRKVSVDFQESMWIFGSAVVVLLACLVVLPLAYLVDLSASAFYVFLSGMLILCTAMVMALMTVPKIHRLGEADQASTMPSKYDGPASSSTEATKPGKPQVHPSLVTKKIGTTIREMDSLDQQESKAQTRTK